MTDIDEKYRERWKDKRKKTYDWKRLVIMILALIAILYALNRLNKVGKTQESGVEFVDPESSPSQEGQQ
ncbi:MAG: hypothetical protein GXY81_05855 [Candidatus Cloacimonetes bacterium]|nr:hypothetical protein [Candidatus Cloacimonadota bacterium]